MALVIQRAQVSGRLREPGGQRVADVCGVSARKQSGLTRGVLRRVGDPTYRDLDRRAPRPFDPHQDRAAAHWEARASNIRVALP
jgi:hypothetical protein